MKSVTVFLAAISGLLLCTPVFSDEQFDELVEKAKAGDADAQFDLGGMYRFGVGVPKDYVEAVKWISKAAEQGDAESQLNLGDMYRRGNGVPKDDVEAAKWVRKAAEQGDADAQFNLGVMHYVGRRAPKDYARAYMWLNLAAAKGSEKAAEGRDKLAKRMTKEQIAESQKLTREWVARKAKEKGE